MSLALELRGVVKRYPGADRPALDGVDLDLAPGGTLALLGPNGAGKSTIASLVAGLIRPDAGDGARARRRRRGAHRCACAGRSASRRRRSASTRSSR